MIVQDTRRGLQIAARALLDAGDAVWKEEPGFWGAYTAFESAVADVVPVPVDGSGLGVAGGMRRWPDARVAYVTPSRQFPLGSVMSLPRRPQLLDWAAERHAWIIEDDCDSEYRFAGELIAALRGLDNADRVNLFRHLQQGDLAGPAPRVHRCPGGGH